MLYTSACQTQTHTVRVTVRPLEGILFIWLGGNDYYGGHKVSPSAFWLPHTRILGPYLSICPPGPTLLRINLQPQGPPVCLGRRPVTVQRHGRAAQAAGRGGIRGKGPRHYQDKGTLFGTPQCEPDDAVRAQRDSEGHNLMSRLAGALTRAQRDSEGHDLKNENRRSLT